MFSLYIKKVVDILQRGKAVCVFPSLSVCVLRFDEKINKQKVVDKCDTEEVITISSFPFDLPLLLGASLVVLNSIHHRETSSYRQA